MGPVALAAQSGDSHVGEISDNAAIGAYSDLRQVLSMWANWESCLLLAGPHLRGPWRLHGVD